jgi:hypothetical protein
MGTIKNSFLLILLLTAMFRSTAQVDIPGSLENKYFSLLRLKNPQVNHLSYWPSINPVNDTLQWNPWEYYSESIKVKEGFEVLNPFSKISYNSTYPRGYNDGPIWKGKGITWELHAGVSGKFKRFSYTLMPVVFYSQNSSFELAPRIKDDVSKYSYQFSNKFAVSYRVDWVQRYGDQAFVKLHPGQSEVRYADQYFSMGLSTQNFKLGPSVISPLIMSRNAPGFPHIDIGTSKPQNLRFKNIDLGKFETKLLYGLFSESKYFDTIPDNSRRYFTGLTVGYSLPFLPNLTFGLNKVLYKSTLHFEPFDLLAVFYIFDTGVYVDTIKTKDAFDQMASIFIDWTFPQVGLRTYLEWARNDFSGDFRRMITEPEHSRAYTLGLQKAFDLASDKALLLTVEHTNLIRNQSWRYRPNPPYYQHIIVDHGYTNAGQILGAGTGGGSRVEYISLGFYQKNGLLGIDFQAIRFDDDYFNEHVQGYNIQEEYNRHDNEYSLGFKYQRNYDRLVLGATMTNSYRLNQYYVLKNDRFNLALALSIKYLIK